MPSGVGSTSLPVSSFYKASGLRGTDPAYARDPIFDRAHPSGFRLRDLCRGGVDFPRKLPPDSLQFSYAEFERNLHGYFHTRAEPWPAANPE